MIALLTQAYKRFKILEILKIIIYESEFDKDNTFWNIANEEGISNVNIILWESKRLKKNII